MFNTVIAGYSRSPFTMARKGELIDVKPVNLLAEVVNNLVSKTKINKEDIGTPEELMKIMRDTIKSH